VLAAGLQGDAHYPREKGPHFLLISAGKNNNMVVI
jgi:hypothetical protein